MAPNGKVTMLKSNELCTTLNISSHIQYSEIPRVVLHSVSQANSLFFILDGLCNDDSVAADSKIDAIMIKCF